jgi:hypothetical protein
MGKNTKSFQTKLKATNKSGNAWNVVGRSHTEKRKPIADSMLETELSNKKVDQIMTPPREADTQHLTGDALTTPIPDSPVSDPDEDNLIAAILLPGLPLQLAHYFLFFYRVLLYSITMLILNAPSISLRH